MPHALFAGSTAGQLPYTKDMDLPSAMVQSPLHQRAALRTSAINYSQPVGLPSLAIVKNGLERSTAAASPSLPPSQHPSLTPSQHPSLPPSQHPLLPAQRRKRQQQGALERMRATAGAENPQGPGNVQANGVEANTNTSCQPSIPGPVLSWGSSIIITDHHSLLPPALAEHLAQVSVLHDRQMEAAFTAELAAGRYLESVPEHAVGSLEHGYVWARIS